MNNNITEMCKQAYSIKLDRNFFRKLGFLLVGLVSFFAKDILVSSYVFIFLISLVIWMLSNFLDNDFGGGVVEYKMLLIDGFLGRFLGFYNSDGSYYYY